MTRYWLGVVSRDHVRRGVKLGFAQANHGKRAAVERMSPGDGLVYYSPRTGMREGEPIKSFTALGTIAEGPAWQVEEPGGCFRPWRRAVDYDPAAREVPIDELRTDLDLTSVPNWGIVLRRGLVELSAHDFEVISRAMVGQ
ncbi:EVE domain-containing protein [Nocardia sp. CDC153]|uniref:EVE domain-containing protein n=1 Tax=Nocardia sp. CDC153 TaxID=3112167 RepID=UPI002DBA659D|nr:EVE domain-containing protein [Nocardia sp. CDC153]MEC3952388.1 EVE domain-containing protein [Nocardia sp. CDC153]